MGMLFIHSHKVADTSVSRDNTSIYEEQYTEMELYQKKNAELSEIAQRRKLPPSKKRKNCSNNKEKGKKNL